MRLIHSHQRYVKAIKTFNDLLYVLADNGLLNVFDIKNSYKLKSSTDYGEMLLPKEEEEEEEEGREEGEEGEEGEGEKSGEEEAEEGEGEEGEDMFGFNDLLVRPDGKIILVASLEDIYRLFVVDGKNFSQYQTSGIETNDCILYGDLAFFVQEIPRRGAADVKKYLLIYDFINKKEKRIPIGFDRIFLTRFGNIGLVDFDEDLRYKFEVETEVMSPCSNCQEANTQSNLSRYWNGKNGVINKYDKMVYLNISQALRSGDPSQIAVYNNYFNLGAILSLLPEIRALIQTERAGATQRDPNIELIKRMIAVRDKELAKNDDLIHFLYRYASNRDPRAFPNDRKEFIALLLANVHLD